MVEITRNIFILIWRQLWFKNLINYGFPILLCLVAFVEYTHIRPISVISENSGSLEVYSTPFPGLGVSITDAVEIQGDIETSILGVVDADVSGHVGVENQGLMGTLDVRVKN